MNNEGRRASTPHASFVLRHQVEAHENTPLERSTYVTKRANCYARLAMISTRRFTMDTGQRKEIANQSLILLHSDELPDTYREAATIEGSGGQVLHIYGSRVMIGQVPAQIHEKVAANKAVQSLRVAAPATAP